MADNGSQKSVAHKVGDYYPEMSYFMNESKSDVIFTIDGRRVPAVRQFLAMKSTHFRTMFSGKFAETDKQEIEIKDTTYEAFKAVIWFLYSHRLMFTNSKDFDDKLVADVCSLADRYQIRRLLDKIGKYSVKCLSMDTLMFVSQMVFTYKLPDCLDSIETFIDHNYDELIKKSDDYLIQLNGYTGDYVLKTIIRKAREPKPRDDERYDDERSDDNHRWSHNNSFGRSFHD